MRCQRRTVPQQLQRSCSHVAALKLPSEVQQHVGGVADTWQGHTSHTWGALWRQGGVWQGRWGLGWAAARQLLLGGVV